MRTSARILLIVLAATALWLALSGMSALADQVGPGPNAPVADQIGPGV